ELEAPTHPTERGEPVEQPRGRGTEFQPGQQSCHGVVRHVFTGHGHRDIQLLGDLAAPTGPGQRYLHSPGTVRLRIAEYPGIVRSGDTAAVPAHPDAFGLRAV